MVYGTVMSSNKEQCMSKGIIKLILLIEALPVFQNIVFSLPEIDPKTPTVWVIVFLLHVIPPDSTSHCLPSTKPTK